MKRHAIATGLLGALFIGPNVLVPLNTYDGGLAASAGTFLIHGAVPYRDFWWLYGPASPVLVGVVSAALGPSLLVLRILGMLIIGAQAAIAYGLIRAHAPHVVAALVAIGGVGATAFVNGVEPSAWSLALALALAALLLRREGRNLAAGLLVGLAFLARLDVGVYGLIALLLTTPRRDLLTGFGVCAGLFGAIVLLSTPLGDAIQQLIWFPLIGTRQFRYVPPPSADDLVSALLFASLVIIPKVAIAATAVRELLKRPRSSQLAPLIVFGALCQLQTLSRGDIYHQAQAALPGLILLGVLAGPSAIRDSGHVSRPRAYARLGLFAGLASTCAICLVLGGFSLLRMETGVMGSLDAAFVAAVRTLASNTGATEPIFVGLTANRITLLNPMLAYYLADRRSGTWGTMYNPGVTNTDSVQRRMVDELTSSRTQVLYLDDTWAQAAEGTNDSVIPGSTILDAFIASTYVQVCDYGSGRIVATRERAPSIVCAPLRDDRLLDVLVTIRP